VSEVVDWARTSPVAFVLLTLLAYRLGREVRTRTGGHPLAQPVLVAIVLVGAVLLAADVDYAAYRSGTEIIAFWLGPATVALAVPLWRQLPRLRGMVLPILVGLPLGAVVSIAVGYAVVLALGGGEELALTMAPKSATSPVAIALADEIGGIPALAAVLAIITGTMSAVVGPAVMTWVGLRDRRTRGLAMGAVAHGIGTSRSLQDDETEGAFSGLAMGLTALAVSLLLPVVLLVLGA
jgi:predicted murein hydrolase (TIGR00659 family)